MIEKTKQAVGVGVFTENQLRTIILLPILKELGMPMEVRLLRWMLLRIKVH